MLKCVKASTLQRRHGSIMYRNLSDSQWPIGRDLITDSEMWQLGGPQRAWSPSPSFHRWENWDLPGLSDQIKSQYPSLKIQDANQLLNSQENVLSPNSGYLFHGPDTWPADNSGLRLHASNHTAQEPGATAWTWVCVWRIWVSRWSSDLIREGKTNVLTSSSGFIKSPLCLKPCVMLLGNFKESLSCDPRRGMAFTAEGGRTLCNWTLINHETTYQKRRKQIWTVMTSRERRKVAGTSLSAARSPLQRSGWYLTQIKIPEACVRGSW